MAAPAKTSLQKISDLVEWYLADRGVELRFRPNPKRTGRLAPEFDFEFWQDGRRITERTLAMMLMIELAERNYAYQLSRVIAGITAHAWRYYVAHQEYPEWLAADLPPVIKRPVGRPRKHPPAIPFPINNSTEESQ